jgi:hypothetical protein
MARLLIHTIHGMHICLATTGSKRVEGVEFFA